MKGKICIMFLLQTAVLSVSLVLFTSCSIQYVTIGLPSTKETSAIKEGKQVFVLLRVTGNFENGSRIGIFDFILEREVELGLYYDDPQGEFELINPQRFLSSEAKEQGWIYFITKPATHYLAFSTGCTGMSDSICESKLNRARLWQIVIPKDTLIVYIGSMHLCCKRKILADRCWAIDENKMFVRSEESLAKQLAERYLSEFGSIQTVLMKPFD